jgi:hypothetical protein
MGVPSVAIRDIVLGRVTSLPAMSVIVCVSEFRINCHSGSTS